MRILPALLAVLALAACQTPMPAPPEPLSFGGPAYTFDVASVSIAQDYKSPRSAPNVEHLADISPAKAIEQWAGTRIKAAGHQNSLEVDIKDASVVRTQIPKKKTGIEGLLTTEQTEEYEGKLEVEIKIYGARSPLPAARVSAAARQTLSLPENASSFDRERLYHRMTADLLNLISSQLDSNIHRYLSAYLL